MKVDTLLFGISSSVKNLSGVSIQFMVKSSFEVLIPWKSIMSGARSDRPGLDEAMKFMREGDTLIVWRLDRLGIISK